MAVVNNLLKMVKPKKWVALLGYSGHGYYGMQRQTCDNKTIDNLPTIESELFKSFYEAGMINENEFNTPNLMRFQRAARTDKGVSAVKQIISFSIANDVAEYLPKVNQLLPPHIRMFSAKKATKYFDSKNFCDARTYSYLLPSFAICPVDQVTQEDFTVSKETISEFNTILKMFTGTHNFHNFTAGKKPTDASAKRFIISFECSEPFLMSDGDKKIEVLVARVKGQSFMLHQIRKMIGLAIAVMRGFVSPAAITRAFGNERLDVPIAPGLGLLLEEVHYERYNKKYGGDGHHEALLWDDVNDTINSFKNEHIYPRIVKTELEEKSMFNWLATLPIHTFDVRTHQIINKSDAIDKPLVRAHFNATQKTNVKENPAPEAEEEEATSSENVAEKRQSLEIEDVDKAEDKAEKRIKLDV